MSRCFRCCFALLLAALVVACISRGPWTRKDDPTPWIAPGQRAQLFFREVTNYGVTGERAWRDAAGRDYMVNDIQDDIEEFLFKTGIMAQWPDSNQGNEHGTMRLAPFRFILVSVNPSVVLMSPFDFGSSKGRAASEVLAPIWQSRCLGNVYMANWLECDVTAPFAPEMAWFSHDLKRAPGPIGWKDGRAEIDLANGERLTLSQDGDMVRTERTAR